MATHPNEFVEFHAWAARNGLNYAIDFCESSDEWAIKVWSSHETEGVRTKHCSSLSDFIETCIKAKASWKH